MNLTKLTKTEFKRLHSNGELLLIAGSVKGNVKTVSDMVQAKLDQHENLSDYGMNTTSYGFIDNKENKVYQSEENNLIFLENTWTNNLKKVISYTTVYLIN